MSSELASLTDNPGMYDLYSASKAALNMLVKCFAARGHDATHAIVLMAPGWVRTEIGGEDAMLSVEDSIAMVAATLDVNLNMPGLRYVDRFGRTIPW